MCAFICFSMALNGSSFRFFSCPGFCLRFRCARAVPPSSPLEASALDRPSVVSIAIGVPTWLELERRRLHASLSNRLVLELSTLGKNSLVGVCRYIQRGEQRTGVGVRAATHHPQQLQTSTKHFRQKSWLSAVTFCRVSLWRITLVAPTCSRDLSAWSATG